MECKFAIAEERVPHSLDTPQESEDDKRATDVILVEQHVNFDRTFLR